MRFVHAVYLESLHVVVILISIVVHGRPNGIGVELLNNLNVVPVMVRQIEIRLIEFTFFGYHKYLIAPLEFPEIITASVNIEAKGLFLKPYLTAAEGGFTFLLKRYFVNIIFGQNVTH